jgi:hypothetical protein
MDLGLCYDEFVSAQEEKAAVDDSVSLELFNF